MITPLSREVAAWGTQVAHLMGECVGKSEFADFKDQVTAVLENFSGGQGYPPPEAPTQPKPAGEGFCSTSTNLLSSDQRGYAEYFELVASDNPLFGVWTRGRGKTRANRNAWVEFEPDFDRNAQGHGWKNPP